MKKKLLLFFYGALSVPIFGQVGVNTTSPKATLDVVATAPVGTKPEGILIPRISGDNLRTADLNSVYGLSQDAVMVFVTEAASAANRVGQAINIDQRGLYYYDNPKNVWVKASCGCQSDIISALNCAGAVTTGSLMQNTAASGVSSQISYTGGNSTGYALQAATSTGVTGLTATRAAGTLSNGNGNVVYTITGTPSTSGTASFAVSLGGQSCSFTIPVASVAAVSALNCAGAVITGSLMQNTAASGVSSQISYTGGNSAGYALEAATSTGVTGLTATRAAGTLSNGNGNVVYTITGTPSTSGTASFAVSLGGQSCSFTIPVASVAAVSALNCAGAVTTGSLMQNTAASGVSSQISYTGGNSAGYALEAATSTGVTGLTATRAAGTLSNGNGNVVYTITGTPSTSGTASFAVSLGGQSCSFTIPVASVAAVSALNCAGAVTTGSLMQNTAASGVSSQISYTGGNSVGYALQAVTSTGVTGLTATRAAGTLSNGNGNVVYTITGTPSTSGTASFAVSLGGQSCSFTIPVASVAAVSALNCAGAVTTGSLTQNTAASGVSSQISYTGGNSAGYALEVVTSTGVTGLTATRTAGTLSNGNGNVEYTITGTPSSYGTASFAISLGGQSCNVSTSVAIGQTVVLPGNQKAWMRHNLGANTSLDPDVPVQAIHGNLYQWGRATVVANASTSDSAIAGWNTTPAPNNSWQDATKTTNDPCPAGFRIPTYQQFKNLVDNNVASNVGTFVSSYSNFGSAKVFTGGGDKLTFPATANRKYTDGSLNGPFGGGGVYWSSQGTVSGGQAMHFNETNVGVNGINRLSGFSLRCISE